MTADSFRHHVAPSVEFNEGQLETLKVILDTFIAPLPKNQEDELVLKLKDTHTEDQVRNFCRLSSTSLQSLETVKNFVNTIVLPDKRKELLLLLSLLSSRAGTFALTGYFSAFKNLSLTDREAIFINWKNSRLPQLRLLYKTFHGLSCHPAYAAYSELLGVAMHYTDLVKDQKYESVPNRLDQHMLTPEQVHEGMKFDVVVIGSGAGGGVVAGQLAKAGKSVLVVEKGAYHHESEFLADEFKAYENLYEYGGSAPSFEGSIIMMAGSVFGGGTTVNWCASLKPQHFVREEWAKQGLSHFLSPKFANDLDRVFERIGATTDGIVHNKTNQILIDGCKILGYPVEDIPQNTGGRPHECELCFTGCRAGIKNGSMNTWLRDASEHDAKFLVKTKVNRVITENGKAVGVECILNNGSKVNIKADQVVVSAGSLQSPGVLLRSGLTNKNIGHNLRLHPCSVTFGFFDREIRTFQGSIMTAVSTVAESVDNDGYGAKLEVPCLHPGSFSAILPWRGAAAHKEMMMRYDRCAPLLVLTRDKDSVGSVRYDDKDNVTVDFNLSNRDRRSIMAGIERSLNVLVAAGAREVQTGQFGVDPFVFEDTEESRVDNPRFLAWKEQVIKYGLPQQGAGIFCAHQMGSNRMGISPLTSVVKPTGETWEVKDLFVADASVFPTSSGVNPMVTTEAIAFHIADCILSKNSNGKL